MNRLPLISFVMLILASFLLGGCSRWSVASTEKKPWKLQAPRMSPNTVVLELAFVRLDPGQPQEAFELWREVDEQVISPDLRKRLNANGFRCGMVGSQLPPVLQQLLDHPDAVAMAAEDPEKLADDITARQYRLQSREGVRTPIAATTDIDSLNVLINDEGGLRGETFRMAKCLFGVRTFPKGDGRVQLEVVPEIEHGEPRNRWVGQEGVMRLEFKRERKEFDSLRMDVVLSPGDVFAISTTPEAVGLGQSFFVKGPQQSTMLLIRLAQVQKDDLFEAADADL